MTISSDTSLKNADVIIREKYDADVNIQKLQRLIAEVRQSIHSKGDNPVDPLDIAKLDYLEVQIKEYTDNFYPRFAK